MTVMTLRELCDSSGVSRRAIQGYEQAGLVQPTGKNKYGHLVYDENSQNRIRQIRICQRMGFTLKEISTIIDARDEVIAAAIEKQVQVLEAEAREKEEIITIARDLLNNYKQAGHIF